MLIKSSLQKIIQIRILLRKHKMVPRQYSQVNVSSNIAQTDEEKTKFIDIVCMVYIEVK